VIERGGWLPWWKSRQVRQWGCRRLRARNPRQIFQASVTRWEVVTLCQLQGLRVLIFCLLCVFQTALVSPTSEQFDLLLRQLRERLDDGRGETIYEIGIGLGIFIDAFSVLSLKSEMASFHFNDSQLSCSHVCNLMMKHLLQFQINFAHSSAKSLSVSSRIWWNTLVFFSLKIIQFLIFRLHRSWSCRRWIWCLSSHLKVLG
jgi:hypothetical protein